MKRLALAGPTKPAFPGATHGASALLAACALALSAGGVQAASSVWAVDRYGTGHVYEWVADSIDWDSARLQARARSFDGVSGHLATITSAAENDFDGSNTRPGYFVEYELPAVASVPEPSALALSGLGVLALAGWQARRRKRGFGAQGGQP